MPLDGPNRLKKKTLGLDNTLALNTASGIVPRSGNWKSFGGYPAKCPLLLRRSAWRFIVQRFIDPQNLIGSDGL
jgi:hypothetical protein